MSPSAGVGWAYPSEWIRDGRGRDWSVELETPQVIDALAAVASRLDVDLELLTCSRIQSGREWFSVFTREPVSDLRLEGPWNYFIRVLSLTPAIPAPEPLAGVGWPALFAVNGLVALQHPEPGRQKGPLRSNIGIVHRVLNTRTGAVREHTAYDNVFGRLKRELRSRASG